MTAKQRLADHLAEYLMHKQCREEWAEPAPEVYHALSIIESVLDEALDDFEWKNRERIVLESTP